MNTKETKIFNIVTPDDCKCEWCGKPTASLTKDFFRKEYLKLSEENTKLKEKITILERIIRENEEINNNYYGGEIDNAFNNL